MFWVGFLLALLWSGVAAAQGNPGFVQGAVLCANTGCSQVPPINPFGLNQAFMNKMDKVISLPQSMEAVFPSAFPTNQPINQFWVDVGNYPIAGMWPVGYAQGIVASMVVPPTYTQAPVPNAPFSAWCDNQGVVRVDISSCVDYFAVALADANTINVGAWGYNVVLSNTDPLHWKNGPHGVGKDFSQLIGLEVDFSLWRVGTSAALPQGSAYGVFLTNGTGVTPLNSAYGVVLFHNPLNAQADFGFGLQFMNASTVVAIDIGQSAVWNGIPNASMPVQWHWADNVHPDIVQHQSVDTFGYLTYDGTGLTTQRIKFSAFNNILAPEPNGFLFYDGAGLSTQTILFPSSNTTLSPDANGFLAYSGGGYSAQNYIIEVGSFIPFFVNTSGQISWRGQNAASYPPFFNSNVAMQMIGANNGFPGVSMYGYGTGNGTIIFAHSSGPLGTEAVPQAGDSLGSVGFRGWNGTAYSVNAAVISTDIPATWVAGSSQPTYVHFRTTAPGTIATADALQIWTGVIVGAGGTDPGAGNLLVQGGHIKVQSMPTTPTTGGPVTPGFVCIDSNGVLYTTMAACP